jgi:biopolymer transport protein ExbD
MRPEAGTEVIFADINITPLTDVFLVMVVIFMVGAIVVHVERSVDTPSGRVDQRGPAVKSTSGSQTKPASVDKVTHAALHRSRS